MTTFLHDHQADVIVVGAGLAGLAATLELTRAGHRVHLIEARPVPGGLCATEYWDGLEYPIACNEFGGGLVRRVSSLGVRHAFKPAGARFVVGADGEERNYHLPPSFRTLGPWLARAPELVRLGLALRSESREGVTTSRLGDVLDRIGASDALHALGGVLGYAYGMPARDVPVDLLLAESSKRYGYDSAHSFIPIGGPAALAESLVSRARALGARVDLGARVEAIERDAQGWVVTSELGVTRTRAVVTSTSPGKSMKSASERPGLRLASIRLRLAPGTRLPRDLHTIARLPDSTERLFDPLLIGEQSDLTGFHFLDCGTPDREDGSIAAQILLFTPHGCDRTTDVDRDTQTDRCLAQLDRMLPGITSQIDATRWVDAAEIESRTGLSMAVVPHLREPGEAKPDVVDDEPGLYHVGTRFGPPGDHAGAAWLSGRWAAEALERLAVSGNDRSPRQCPPYALAEFA